MKDIENGGKLHRYNFEILPEVCGVFGAPIAESEILISSDIFAQIYSVRHSGDKDTDKVCVHGLDELRQILRDLGDEMVKYKLYKFQNNCYYGTLHRADAHTFLGWYILDRTKSFCLVEAQFSY